jgi:hypothetical protein
MQSELLIPQVTPKIQQMGFDPPLALLKRWLRPNVDRGQMQSVGFALVLTYGEPSS